MSEEDIAAWAKEVRVLRAEWRSAVARFEAMAGLRAGFDLVEFRRLGEAAAVAEHAYTSACIAFFEMVNA
jgi:hypothetical protein